MAFKNFAYSTILTAPSPALSGTSFVVQSGDGAKFPSESFYATVWPATAQPLASNAEVVLVTAISTDTFTITRAQQSSTARTILVGDQIAATLTTAVRPAGTFVPYGGRAAPIGFLMCDGSAVSRTTYADLFAILCENMGTFTVTIATPGVVSFTAHGLNTGDQVYLTTTGALPTGLLANTLYYVIKVDANSFNLATSRANAFAATKIATSGTQSGTHTLRWCPYGLGDGSTTFTLPDFRGRTLAGADAMGGTAASRLTLADALGSYGNPGAAGGEQRHTMTQSELVAHQHTLTGYGTASSGGTHTAARGDNPTALTSSADVGSTGSTTPFNLVGPTAVANIIVTV